MAMDKLVLSAVLASTAFAGLNAEDECVKGETKFSNCNSCHCIKGKRWTWTCTQIFCGDSEPIIVSPGQEIVSPGQEIVSPGQEIVSPGQERDEINESVTAILEELNIRTTDEVFSDLKKFENKCLGYFTYVTETDEKTGKSLDYVRIEKPGAHRWQFMTFGLHAREMVTVKSAYHLVQQLCEGWEGLDRTAFLIFPNVNPVSRRVIESTGQWDLRVNENAVDINRNFDWNWESKGIKDDLYPGKKAFSEYQSRILKKTWEKLLLEKNNANVQYFDVHGGRETIVAPLGTDLNTDHPNIRNMLDIFEELQNEFCKECEIKGHLGNKFQSTVKGDALDYFAQNVDYSGLFEIMNPDEGYQKQKTRKEQCYYYFTKGATDHDEILDKWSRVYLSLAEKIFQKTKGLNTTTKIFAIAKAVVNYVQKTFLAAWNYLQVTFVTAWNYAKAYFIWEDIKDLKSRL